MFLHYLEPEKCHKTYPQNSTNFRHAMFLRYLEPVKCQKTYPQNSTNFGHAMFLRYLESEKCQKTYPQNSTNFGHAMFLHYLEPEKCQKPTRKQHEFQQCHNSSLPRASKMPKKPTKRQEFRTKLHSLTPATMPRKVLVFHNFAHRLKYIH